MSAPRVAGFGAGVGPQLELLFYPEPQDGAAGGGGLWSPGVGLTDPRRRDFIVVTAHGLGPTVGQFPGFL
jgi:hypothetical protein